MPSSFKQDKYKLLVEAANDIIFEVDAAGRLTYLNPKVFEVTGYTKNEIQGESFLAFVRDDWKQRTLEYYQEQIKILCLLHILSFPALQRMVVNYGWAKMYNSFKTKVIIEALLLLQEI